MVQPTQTTLATWVFAIHHALEHEGFDSRRILNRLNLDLGELRQSVRVPKGWVNQLWEEAIEVSGNDAFSLRVLHFLNDPALNALITSVQASADVRQALTVLLRYYKVISSGTKISLEIDDSVRLVVSDATPEPYLIPEDVDLVFGLIKKFGSNLPQNEVRPSRLQLTRPAPRHAPHYERFFECPVEFGAPRNVLSFPAHVLDADIPGKNPALSNHVEQFLASQTTRLGEQSLEEKLRSALVTMLPAGTPKLDQLANKLNMSKRTLQRKLQSENLCFKSTLNKMRLDMAKQFLTERSMPVQEIAYRLGFSEPSNFVRFFKQQAGIRPSDFEQDDRPRKR
ncbi:MAG: AraC family transcriptional regulator [Oleiphilaceae bacterium]|nr:AraC family transcriptional regulator [Oleiphilaceae bacterium]